jgi:hypothetical protein
MDSQKIKVILVVILSAIAAVYLGIAAATAQTVAILWVAGIVGIVLVLALGKNIWLLIAAGAVLNGGLNFLPGAVPPWWLAMMLTAGIFTLRFAMRRTEEFTWRWNAMDLVILLHIAMLAQAYIRNPVGLTVFGGSSEGMIGGRPYIIHAFAITCYVLLSMVRTDMRMFRFAVIVMICCAFFDGMAALIGTFIPAIAAIGIKFYSGFSFVAATSGVGADIAGGRTIEGAGVGKDLGQAAFTLYRPLSTLNPLNLLPFLMISVAVYTVMISGFRSVMGLLAIYFVLGSLIRGKIADVMVAGMISVIGLCALLFIGTERLPRAAQRILSVLPIPGLVDEEIKDNAAASTDWRVEMWVLALTTDRYIFNKMWGDGFGMRKDEMDAMIDAAFGDNRAAKGLDMQEVMMRRGSYHGFHVQTIRMTGYIGLLAVLIMLGVFFRHAWNHIQYFKGRPEWGFVLFVCVPFLVFPFYAMLVFGDYRFGLPRNIIMAGFLKMLWNIRFAESQEFAYQRRLEETEELTHPTTRRERPVRALPAPRSGAGRVDAA